MKKFYFVLFLCALFFTSNALLAQPLLKNQKGHNKIKKNVPIVNVFDKSVNNQKSINQIISSEDNIIRFNSGILKDHITNTWFVDPLGTDDGSHGSGTGTNAFHTIQYAIDDSRITNGDILNVAAGIYIEQVYIYKMLTINGAGPTTIIKSPATLTRYFTSTDPNYPVVYVNGVTSGITINNLKVDGDHKGNANYRFQGIGFWNSGGSVSNVDVVNIMDNPFSGNQHGNGIYAFNNTPLTNYTITLNNVNITEFQKTGIALNGNGNLTVNINNVTTIGKGATSVTAQNGIQVWGGNGTISNCNISQIAYTGTGIWTATGLLIYGPATVTADNVNINHCQTSVYWIDAEGTYKNSTITYPLMDGIYGYASSGSHTFTVANVVMTGVDLNGSWGINPLTNGGTMNMNINDCIISHCNYGIYAYDYGTTGGIINTSAHNNNLASNIYGVGTNATTVQNATSNWWGSVSGPKHSTDAGVTWIPIDGGVKVDNNINYDPWTGAPEAGDTHVTGPGTIHFPASGTTMNFTSVPPGTNATVTVTRIESSTPPAGIPAPPAAAGTVIPLYLQITATGLANYTFTVTITIDVSTIPGFGAGSEVMYYSTASHSWVGISGSYNASTHMFTFTTDHFTTYAFVNPLNPDDVYICSNASAPETTRKWYPQVGMGDPSTYGDDDWRYTHDSAVFYVVPSGTQGIFSSKFFINWDKSKGNITLEAGNYWSSQQFFMADSSSPTNGKYWVNVASTNLKNQVPEAGKYLAKIKMSITAPGYIPLSLDATDFRYYNNDEQQGVYVTTHTGYIIFYLGDFANSSTNTIGDGRIDGNDMSLFTAAYWSIAGKDAGYRWKYDIGPTNANGSYWAMPNPDGKIEFEDLNIFAIGYGKTAAYQLPQGDNANTSPVIFSVSKQDIQRGDNLKVPLKVSGNVKDLRSFSLKMNYNPSELEYVGVEKAGGLNVNEGLVIGKTENNQLYVDGALVGTDEGLNGEQLIFNLVFNEKASGNHDISIANSRARNSGNVALKTNYDGQNGTTNMLPTRFDLAQNYPNPFNPVTSIKYQLPKDVKVMIKVYDVLGRELQSLVNEVQKAGYYEVKFDGSSVASGIYFYKIVAGDYSSVKKMMLVK